MNQNKTLQVQMFVVSECLKQLGYRKLSRYAKRPIFWEFANEFINLTAHAAERRKDYGVLKKLYLAVRGN